MIEEYFNWNWFFVHTFAGNEEIEEREYSYPIWSIFLNVFLMLIICVHYAVRISKVILWIIEYFFSKYHDKIYYKARM